MVWYSTETVMALHKARVDEERRSSTGRSRRRKALVTIVNTPPLRPATAR